MTCDDIDTGATRRSRHAIMRLLQRADWAMQEDDDLDALKEVLRAVRIVSAMDAYLERPEGLSAVVAAALVVALEDTVESEGMSKVLDRARPLLVLDGERFRGCGYGM
ncbi:MAG: hypothetical protein ACRYHQ_32335 [Janthinobacterium lividum]